MSHPPVILITGASGGVGQAAALACARQGARIAIAYQQNQTAADSLLASLPHGPHSVHQADITQPEQAEALIDT
ncbi:MAG: NAD(P)-dependent dehydrogenase (short-subunit alcohol dehydrogenase family), partial [Candidatus Azotimanducaceae bacterium]